MKQNKSDLEREIHYIFFSYANPRFKCGDVPLSVPVHVCAFGHVCVCVYCVRNSREGRALEGGKKTGTGTHVRRGQQGFGRRRTGTAKEDKG